jgi:hypothetical protein
MVKRRNSPYASHDRSARTRVPIDCTPSILLPMPRTVTIKVALPQLWTPTNVAGHFFI